MVKKSKIVLITKVTFATLLLTVFLGSLLLFKGLTFNTITFPSVVIEGLYIKLDKKLVVSAKNVTLTLPSSPKEREDNSAQKGLVLLQNVSWLGHLISPIIIENFTIHADHTTITLKNFGWFHDQKISLMTQEANITLTPSLKKREKERWDHTDLETIKQFFPEFDTFSVGSLHLAMPQSDLMCENITVTFHRKLALYAQHIAINYRSSSKPFGFDDLTPFFEKLFPLHDTLTTLVENIDLPAITINHAKPIAIHIDDKISLSTPDFLWEGVLTPKDNTHLTLTTHRFALHNTPLSLKGGVLLSPFEKSLSGEIVASVENISLKTSLEASPKEVTIDTKSNTFTSLAPFAKFFPTSPSTQEWITKRVKALHFTFETHTTLDPKNFQIRSLTGTTTLLHPSIIFNPSLPPVKSDKLVATIEKEGVLTSPISASLGDISLHRLTLHIKNLFSAPSLNLTFETPTLLTKEVTTLLESYDLSLPFVQTKGVNQTSFALGMNLENLSTEINLTTHVKDGVFNNQERTFVTQEGQLRVVGDKITFDIDHLRTDNLNLSSQGEIDMMTRKGRANLFVHNATIGDNAHPLVSVKEYSFPVDMNFNTGIDLSFPTLYTHLQHHNDSTTITTRHLSSFYPFIPFTQELHLEDGALHLEHTPSHLLGQGNLMGTAPLFTNRNNKSAPFLFSFKQEGDNFFFSTYDKMVTFSKTPQQIKADVKDHDLNLSALTKVASYVSAMTHPKKESLPQTTMFPPHLDIKLHQSDLLWGQALIPFDDLIVKKDHNLSTLDGHWKTTHLHGALNNQQALFFSETISQEYLEKITGFHGIKAKETHVSLWGPLTQVEGKITLKEGVIKDLGGLNMVLSIINAVPSLFSLDFDFGLGGHGLTFNEATATVSVVDNMVLINDLTIDGAHTDVSAQGYINLTTKEIHLAVTVSTIKALSSLISKIPVVGYLVLGEAKNFETQFVVHGTLDEPEIETFITKGFLLTPLNIAKRVLTYPLEIFHEVNDFVTTKKED